MIGFFYGQTEYNFLNNAIKLEQYIEFAKEQNFKYLTITDRNMHGYYKFYNLCVDNNIMPIIGLELTLSTNHFSDNKLLAYAKNKEGLSNLFKLSLIADETKIVSDEVLSAHCNDLFFISAGFSNDINRFLFDSDFENAKLELFRYQKMGLDFYYGIQPCEQVYYVISSDIRMFIEENNLNILPLSKSSYEKYEDKFVYAVLKKIGGYSDASYGEFHLKSEQELVNEFVDFPDIFDQAIKVVSAVNYNITQEKIKLPSYDSENISSSLDYLSALSKRGLKKRLNYTTKDFDIYYSRLNYELEIINSMGYNDYFLIVWDFVKFAKQNDVLVGPGRGSACGSLVSYCLGITEVDPIEYNLLFERFLNPNRITMPDIDLDFPDDKRDMVIEYVRNKYGIKHVCYITAFGTFQIKSSIRDTARALDISSDYVNDLLKFLETNNYEDAFERYNDHSEILNLLKVAKKINGLVKHISTHAAGIIISSVNLDNYVPLKLGLNNTYQSQLEACDLEKMGLLKIDFLGIRNLTVITNMQKMIGNFNVKNIPLNDRKTYELLQKGDTLGIFQLESAGIRNVLKKMEPNCFEDIVAVLALYRPGPMDNINVYIERKKGAEFSYIISELEPILKDTYGIIVYQEQIMQIANKVAGYTYGEADILRRAVSKKDLGVLEENRDNFVSKSIQMNFDRDIANEIYDYIVKFANYGFNRSHSVAYSMIAYQMAFIKANFKTIFMTSIMNNVIGNTSEMFNYIKYCRSNNIDVEIPHINFSSNECVLIKNKIILPLTTIHKLGINNSKIILDERKNGKFINFDNFINRMGNSLNRDIMFNLISSGAFNEFKSTKKSMIDKLNNNSLGFDKYIKDAIEVEEYDSNALRILEYEALGFNLKYDIFKDYDSLLLKYKANGLANITNNRKVTLIATVDRVKKIKTRNEQFMAFLELNCNYSVIEGVLFPNTYEKYNTRLVGLLLVVGTIKERNGLKQIVIEEVNVLK